MTALLSVSERCVQNTYVQSNRPLAKDAAYATITDDLSNLSMSCVTGYC